jgi:hypothetical protein
LISVLAVCVPAIAYPILLSFEIKISTEIFLACTAFYFILISFQSGIGLRIKVQRFSQIFKIKI